MISFDEALEIAKDNLNKINYCTEYTDAYIFGYDDGQERQGNWGTIVIYKKDGTFTGQTTYQIHRITNRTGSKFIKTIKKEYK